MKEGASKLARSAGASPAQVGPSPSYSPKLAKRATDVAESRNSIHGSGCESESRID
jgi:hypothetical protein